MTLTTLLATWGAVLSTLVAVWNIFKDVRDRGRLRVEAYLEEWDDFKDVERIRRYHVVIVITNVGRRAVIAHAFGAGAQKTWRQYFWRRIPHGFRLDRKAPPDFYEATFKDDDVLPKRLEPGDFVQINWEKFTHWLTEKRYEDGPLFVRDSLGNYFFASKSSLDRIRRNYRPDNPREGTIDHMIGRIRYH